jgi:hypothetical protein
VKTLLPSLSPPRVASTLRSRVLSRRLHYSLFFFWLGAGGSIIHAPVGPSTHHDIQTVADLNKRLLLYGRPECGFVLPVTRWQVGGHLWDKHRVLLCQRLTHSLQHLLPTHSATFAPSPNLYEYAGYGCRQCRYCAVYHLCIIRHAFQEHVRDWCVSRAERDALYDNVLLQTWTVPRRGSSGNGRYWIAQSPILSSGTTCGLCTSESTRTSCAGSSLSGISEH